MERRGQRTVERWINKTGERRRKSERERGRGGWWMRRRVLLDNVGWSDTVVILVTRVRHRCCSRDSWREWVRLTVGRTAGGVLSHHHKPTLVHVYVHAHAITNTHTHT